MMHRLSHRFDPQTCRHDLCAGVLELWDGIQCGVASQIWGMTISFRDEGLACSK